MCAMQFDRRQSGLSLIGDLPWGSRFCQFYQSEQDLYEILAPYFQAGLDVNELCLWVTAAPLPPETAGQSLATAIPQLAPFLQRGQIEIVSDTQWHARGGASGSPLVSSLDRAILRGFDGLRLFCQVNPEDPVSKAFADAGTETLSRYNVIGLFAYPRDRFDALRLMEVVRKHRCALVRNSGGWEVIESSEVQIMKDTLQRSEEKLQSLFSHMSEGFAYHRIVLDEAGRPCDYIFLEVNEAFERLTGLKAKALVGKRASQALPGIEYDPADWIGKYGQVALTGQPMQFESYASILEKWFAVSAFSSHKGFFAVTFSDITARRQAEEALARERERLRVTLTSIGDAVIAGDTDGRITFLNPVAEELTGWRAQEALGQPIQAVFRIINELTRKPAEDIAARVLRERRIVGLANHTSLLAKDGREIPIEDSAAPILDAAGQVSGVVLVFHDVTPKRHAQLALRQSEERLTLAQQAGGVGVLDWDLASGRVIWTAELEAIFGLPAGTAAGTYAGWAGLVHPEDLSRVEAQLREWRESRRENGRWQYRIIRQGGEERWISARGRMIRDASGKALRMISTHLDVTESKRTEIQLLEQGKALAEADRHKDEFLAMLAHELRNPLAPIRYAVQIMTVLDPGKSHLQRQREIIDRQVSHMGRLLDDLLDVSRISRGKIRLQKERLDLRVVLDHAVEVARPQVSDHHHELVYHPAAEPFWLEGDQTRLEQILRNLIGNAIKYTPDSGKIQVTLDRELSGGDAAASWAVIRIRDNGIGIAAEMLPRVFDIFTQADHSLDRAQGGLGLGLTMVKSLAEMHGGNIQAASAGLGKGSEFSLRLPLLACSELPAQASPMEQGAPASAESQRDESLKILVVDDNVDSACSLGELLELWGHQARVAHNGEEAIRMALEFRPDVVLLDIGLPGMNGYEISRRLRSEAALEGTELVAVTGYGMEEDRRHAAQAGFGRHFTKPIDLKALHQMFKQKRKVEKD